MTTRLDYQAAADYLGVKVTTLRSMVSRKQVPHIRLTAATVVFDTTALAAWMPTRDERVLGTMQMDLDEKKAGRDLYAVFCSVTRLCKIGRANDPLVRVRDMQIGSPTKLILWCHAPLLGNLEPTVHLAFAEHRRHGEWFGPALTEALASRVPFGDVEAFARFASEAHGDGAKLRRAKLRRAAHSEVRRGTFEWRGRRRKS